MRWLQIPTDGPQSSWPITDASYMAKGDAIFARFTTTAVAQYWLSVFNSRAEWEASWSKKNLTTPKEREAGVVQSQTVLCLTKLTPANFTKDLKHQEFVRMLDECTNFTSTPPSKSGKHGFAHLTFLTPSRALVTIFIPYVQDHASISLFLGFADSRIPDIEKHGQRPLSYLYMKFKAAWVP